MLATSVPGLPLAVALPFVCAAPDLGTFDDQGTCDPDELQPRIERLLGRAATPDDLAFSSDVHRRADGQWQLELERNAEAPDARRTFVAPSCETVLDAAAFAVAIGINPTLAEPTKPSAEIPEPIDPATASVTTPAPTLPSPRPKPTTDAARERSGEAQSPRTLTGFLRLAGGIDGGGLPRVGAMFEGAGGVRGKWWRAELGGMFRLQSKGVSAANVAIGGAFSMWAVGVRACGVPRVRTTEFPICAGAEGGRIRADGTGFAGARQARAPWAAVVLSPGVAIAIRPNIAFVIQAALGVPLVRTEFTVENLGRIHRTGPAFGRAVIGFEGRFP